MNSQLYRWAALILAALIAVACSDDGGDDAPEGEGADAAAADVTDSEGADDDAADPESDAAAEGGEEPDAEPESDAPVVSDTEPEPDVEPGPEPPACFDDLAPGEAEVFYDGFRNGSEGIAFGPDGRLYVSEQDTGVIWAFDAEGTPTEFATVPTALGLAPSRDGGLWVASIGESINPGDTDGALYKVDAAGQPTMVADGIDSPNFVVELADGSVLVSDDFDTAIWRVDGSGEVTLAIDSIESPNGMGLDRSGENLWVASTFTAIGEITRVPMDEDGLPAADGYEVVAEIGPATLPDGLAVDWNGAVYIAVNLSGRIDRIEGTEVSTVVEDLTNPASMAFGEGEGFDPCSMYVTELLGSKIWRVAVGVPGVPLRPQQ